MAVGAADPAVLLADLDALTDAARRRGELKRERANDHAISRPDGRGEAAEQPGRRACCQGSVRGLGVEQDDDAIARQVERGAALGV